MEEGTLCHMPSLLALTKRVAVVDVNAATMSVPTTSRRWTKSDEAARSAVARCGPIVAADDGDAVLFFPFSILLGYMWRWLVLVVGVVVVVVGILFPR